MHVLLSGVRRLLLAMVAFTLPLTGVGVIEVGLPASPFKVLSAILLVFTVLLFLVTGRLPRRDPKALWVLGYAASFAGACAYAMFQGFPSASLITPVMTVGSLILFYFMISYTIVDRKDLSLFLWALTLGAASSSLPAMLGIQGPSDYHQHGARFEGLASQVNVFGFDMMVVLPIVAALFLRVRSLLAKAFLAGSAALVAGGILLSLSRTAFVASASEYALWAYRFRSISSIKYLLPAVVLVAGALAFAPPSVERRATTVLDPAQRAADGSIQARLRQYEASLEAIVQHPITGVGTRRFIEWAREESSVPGVHNMVHNAYLRVWVEQGVFGVVFFVGIAIVAWRQYSSTWRTAYRFRDWKDAELSELGHWAMFLQIALFGGLVGGVFTHSQDSKSFWVVLTLATVVQGLAATRVAKLVGSGEANERRAAEQRQWKRKAVQPTS